MYNIIILFLSKMKGKAINNFKKKTLYPNFANDLLNAEMELEV